MKKIIIIFITIITMFISMGITQAKTTMDNQTTTANQEEKNLVNLYLFYSKDCPHCHEERKLLTQLSAKYDNLKVYSYEISSPENSHLFGEVTNLFDVKVSGVPFTVIGNQTYNGYSRENSKRVFEAAIEYYSNHGYQDKVGELLGDIPLPTYPIEENDDIEEYINNYGNYTIDIPLIGEIQTKHLTLPLITAIIGLLDGFNPCAMWILLFLISMLIGMKDKKRMWTLGVTFLITSAVIYGVMMMTWLNVTTLISHITTLRVIIAIIAIILGSINIISGIRTKETGCHVVKDQRRNKIFNKIKTITHEKSLILALLGIITLAIGVNIIELACSAGLPVMYLEILALNNLDTWEQIIYIITYLLFFLLDDLIVFVIAMVTMKVTGFSTKYGKVSKIIGGIILLIIGLLLIIKPEWLMFNF